MRKLLLLLSLVLSSTLLFAQKSVTVRVTDAKTGNPVSNASVKIKSSNKGGFTGGDGTITLQVSPDDVLEITSIGYNFQSVKVGNQTAITVNLETALVDIGDVVVVGTRGAPRAKIETAVPVDVIRIMAAEAYLPSARLVAPLALAASIGVLTYVVQTGVLYAKQSADLFRITLIRTMVVAVVAYPVIALFGLNGICTLAIVDALLVLSLTHRASQRYFKVRYEMGRLGMLVALVAAFYVASLPTALLAPYAGMFAKMLLFAAFVVALYASSVLAADEKAWIRQHARLLLARRSHPAT